MLPKNSAVFIWIILQLYFTFQDKITEAQLIQFSANKH